MKYNEQLRSQIHFSPKKNWMNDPNGCVYYKGIFHLFFQYHPFGTEWGPMHWGHAESRDLIHWKEKDIALYPNKKLGMAFSGSAVIDSENLTGFFPDGEGLLAYYTNHLVMQNGNPDLQQQSLAWSTDDGKTWNEYKNNPIIKNPGFKDFRDPKVFYHKLSEKWVMVLSGGSEVLIYVSINLINWVESEKIEFAEDFGTVECPDLFSFKTNTGNHLWLLVVSFLQTDSFDKPTVRYFMGDFDGTSFSFLSGMSNGFVADYGRDFYAPQSWSGILKEDGRKIWIGWCNHWAYSNQVPSESWRGVMSLPRKIFLDDSEGVPILKQEPVDEFKKLRKETEILIDIGKNGKTVFLDSEYSHEFLMYIENPSECSFEFSFNYEGGEFWKLNWESITSSLILDRSNLKSSAFSDFFCKPSLVEIDESEKLELRIILDRSIVEIYVMEGKYVMTNQIFPSNPLTSLKINTLYGDRIKDFTHHTLGSIWNN